MDDALVPNRYLAAVRAHRAQASPAAARVMEVLDQATRAMGAGAWVGGKGDEFGEQLAAHQVILHSRAQNCLDLFDSTIAAQADLVSPDSWHYRWDHRMGGI